MPLNLTKFKLIESPVSNLPSLCLQPRVRCLASRQWIKNRLRRICLWWVRWSNSRVACLVSTRCVHTVTVQWSQQVQVMENSKLNKDTFVLFSCNKTWDKIYVSDINKSLIKEKTTSGLSLWKIADFVEILKKMAIFLQYMAIFASFCNLLVYFAIFCNFCLFIIIIIEIRLFFFIYKKKFY